MTNLIVLFVHCQLRLSCVNRWIKELNGKIKIENTVFEKIILATKICFAPLHYKLKVLLKQ